MRDDAGSMILALCLFSNRSGGYSRHDAGLEYGYEKQERQADQQRRRQDLTPRRFMVGSTAKRGNGHRQRSSLIAGGKRQREQEFVPCTDEREHSSRKKTGSA